MTLTSSPESNQNSMGKYFARFRANLWKQGYRPQYFKVTEFTEMGRRHFHLLIDVFVPFNVIQAAWRAATDGTAYWVNIKKAQVRKAAAYMAKYMTKQTVFSEQFEPGEHRYSFSHKFPRLHYKEPDGEWEFRLAPLSTGKVRQAKGELKDRAERRRTWKELWKAATGG